MKQEYPFFLDGKIAKMSLINVMFHKLTVFLKVDDYKGQVKDANFVVKILTWAIKMVGATNIVQVITSTTPKIVGFIKATYVFFIPCVLPYSHNLVM